MSSAIARVTSILCVPYGYTVTLWCAGALAIADHGLPGRLDVVLFGAGAVAAFLLLGLAGRPHLDTEVPMRVPATLVANAFPVAVALLVAAAPLRALDKPVAFVAASFVATGVYVLSLALVVRASKAR